MILFLLIVQLLTSARQIGSNQSELTEPSDLEELSNLFENSTNLHDENLSEDKLAELLVIMGYLSNASSSFDYPQFNNYSQYGFVIVWRNPYPFPNSTLDQFLARNGDGGDNGGYDHPPRHDFDEMEQRDFIRTVIFLANQQINVKFKLCEMRRFRSHFLSRWNLYRCSARFTVARIGKDCDPDQTYDGYVNFIIQNPELPPLLAIRYYVFQFLYESSLALVKKKTQ